MVNYEYLSKYIPCLVARVMQPYKKKKKRKKIYTYFDVLIQVHVEAVLRNQSIVYSGDSFSERK